MGSNTVVMVVKGRQYSRGGVGGEVIQPWWCWRGSNTVVMVVKGRQYGRGGVGGEAIQL